MSKELPYFKFYPSEWLSGNITLESMELQGVFINVCGIYWSKDCSVAIAGLSNRYGVAIAKLLESGLIKEKKGFAVIEFLDEQWSEFDHNHQKNSKNGKKGADKRWGKNSPPIALREEEIREEEIREEEKIEHKSIEDRKAFFISDISSFRNKYEDSMLQEFAEYWMEHNPGAKKMRFEMEKIFQLERRLSTWNKNQSKFKSNGKQQITASSVADELKKYSTTHR